MPVDTTTKSFLTELLQHTEPFFRNDKERLMIEPQANAVLVRAYAFNGGMFFRGHTSQSLPDFEAVACLGNLSYLRSILEIDSIREAGRLEFTYDKALNGGKALRKITAIGRRAEYTYVAKDPSNAGEQRQGANVENTLDFTLLGEVIREFEEMNRVIATFEDKAKIFTLTYGGGIVKGYFGEGRGIGSVLTFATKVTGKNLDRTISLLIPLDNFRSIMKICSADTTMIRLAERGILMEKATNQALYTYAIAAKKPNLMGL